jgi:hypothetical protein
MLKIKIHFPERAVVLPQRQQRASPGGAPGARHRTPGPARHIKHAATFGTSLEREGGARRSGPGEYAACLWCGCLSHVVLAA